MIGAWTVVVFTLSAEPASIPNCVRAAEEAHQQGDPLMAVRRAEACWRQERDPRALLVAGQASLAARRYAEAWLFARRFLSVDHSKGRSTQRTMGGLILREALKSTGMARVKLEPPPQPDETITLWLCRDGEADDAAIVVDWGEVRSGEAEGQFYLDAGRWQITIARGGFARKRIAVASEAQKEVTQTVAMRRRGAAAADLTFSREPVLVSFTPARVARRGVVVELRPVAQGSAPALRFDVRSEQAGLWLPPGRWQLTAVAGSRSAHQVVHAGGTGEVKVRLR